MAANHLPIAIDDIFTLGEDMADGCRALETVIGLKQNKEDDVRADLIAAINAQSNFKNAQAAKFNLSTAVTVADSNAKAFIGSARKLLVNHLGEGWSPAWEAAGFPKHSTAVPSTQRDRQALLQSLRNYFTANAGLTNAALNLTAARAATLFATLSEARYSAAVGNTECGTKKHLRDEAIAALRKRMIGLINELKHLLNENDPHWLAFGLNLPGASNLPDPADSLVLTGGGPGIVLADWSDASRATRYRVYKQVSGLDATFVPVATVGDSDCTIIGLPSSKTVKVQIISANDAGQSPPTVAETVVP